MRVLVVEDVASLADDITEGLRDHGFAADVAGRSASRSRSWPSSRRCCAPHPATSARKTC
jgi:DNA-binding response OmpR family regulator